MYLISAIMKNKLKYHLNIFLNTNITTLCQIPSKTFHFLHTNIVELPLFDRPAGRDADCWLRDSIQSFCPCERHESKTSPRSLLLISILNLYLYLSISIYIYLYLSISLIILNPTSYISQHARYRHSNGHSSTWRTEIPTRMMSSPE